MKNDIENMIIAQRLRYFIEKYYGLQKNFAEAAGTDANTIGPYVQGRSLPGLLLIKQFNDAGLNIVWLTTGRGQPLDIETKAGELLNQIEMLREEMSRLKNDDTQRYEALLDEIKGLQSKINTPVKLP